jgi:hypothetical protein
MAQRMESVAPAGGAMLSVPTARLVELIVMLAVPMIKAVESVEADIFTAGDTIEAFEPRTATTRPSPRGLCRGSTQQYAWRHAETPLSRPPMPRRHRCALSQPSSFLRLCRCGMMAGSRSSSPQWKSSTASPETSPVARYCNLAGFGAVLLRRGLELPLAQPRRQCPRVVRV